ncbi:MAG: hypothetical protein IKB64_07420 [Paludibacteraceae bacterium]|nr:hypothetical protein [Paludibacteraceae bacterium]
MNIQQIEKKYLSSFDELNTMVQGMRETMNLSEFLDNAEDILIAAYKRGREDVLAMLDYSFAYDLDISKLRTALNEVKGGMTYVNRIILGFENYSLKEMQRLMSAEYHRMYNLGAYEVVEEIQRTDNVAILKEWHTVGDEKVRDTHRYLEGYKVPIEEFFYTFDGDKALYPGGFEKPENNIGCRCILIYTEL